MYKSLVLFLIAISTLITLNACNPEVIKENDILNLSPNYFICDSVDTTPVYYQFTWHPQNNDSVQITISGDACTGIKLTSGWVKDSIITVEIDTKKAVALSVKYEFFLSSQSYNIQYFALVDGFEIISRNENILKDSSSAITKYFSRIYLPLFRLDSFLALEPNNVLCPSDPYQDINFTPYMDEDPYLHSSFTIKDYFKISVESEYPVSIFDRSTNKIIGKEVTSRINDFTRYQLCLTDKSLPIASDSVTITFSKDNFVSKYKMFISDECAPKKLDLREIKIKIGDGGSVYPGDTLDIHLSYKDKNGTEQKFNKNAVFEAGLISGCGAAKILNKDGELKRFFHRIQEPIRIVILDYEDSDWNDRNVNIQIGFISEGE